MNFLERLVEKADRIGTYGIGGDPRKKPLDERFIAAMDRLGEKGLPNPGDVAERAIRRVEDLVTRHT